MTVVTKTFKVFNASPKEGRWDFSDQFDGSRIIEVMNTKNDSFITITRDTEELVDREFYGQLYDGVYENEPWTTWLDDADGLLMMELKSMQAELNEEARND